MTKGKIMKSGPTTSWKKAGEKAEAETDFLCCGSIFNADAADAADIESEIFFFPWQKSYDISRNCHLYLS